MAIKHRGRRPMSLQQRAFLALASMCAGLASQGCALDAIWFTKQDMTIRVIDADTMSPPHDATVSCWYTADDGTSPVVAEPDGLPDADGNLRVSFKTCTIRCCKGWGYKQKDDPYRDRVTGKPAQFKICTTQASETISTVLTPGTDATGSFFSVKVLSIGSAHIE